MTEAGDSPFLFFLEEECLTASETETED